ncbi:MAG: hypothetical protein Q9208_002801 [Pyrenodesmia sp. 3 TL-2023]
MASRRTRSASPRLSGGEGVRRMRSPLAAEDTVMGEGDEGSVGQGSAPVAGPLGITPSYTGDLSPHWTPMMPGPSPDATQPAAAPAPAPAPGVQTMPPPPPQQPSTVAGAQQSVGYRSYPMTDFSSLQEQDQHLGQCDQLAGAIADAWNRARATDGPFADLLRNWQRAVAFADRPNHDQSRDIGVAFFQLTYWSLDGRGVLAWLVTANWDLDRAVQAYMNHRFLMDGAPESERVEGGDEEEEEEGEPYVDEDPDNIGDIPEDLEVKWYGPRGNRKQCVRHEKIRHHLINHAATQGAYAYGRREQLSENGDQTADQTSFLKAQRLWGFEQRSQYPPILFVYKRKDRRDPKYPGDNIPYMRWRGLLVIDNEGEPVRRFRNIPATLSSQVEGGLMEAMMREDSGIDIDDFMARMPKDWNKKIEYPTPGGVQARQIDVDRRTLGARARRFRHLVGCINWYGRPETPSRYDKYLMSVMPQVLVDANSTAGMDHDFVHTQVTNMSQNPELRPSDVPVILGREFPAGADDKARSLYHPDKEHDCRDCMPGGLEDLAALNDALLITVAHFIKLTKKCPRLPLGKNTYRQFVTAVENQLLFEFDIVRRRRAPLLRQLGRWTGGIKRWRSAAVLN